LSVLTVNQLSCAVEEPQAGFHVNPDASVPQGNFTIDNGANVEIKAPQYILFEPGFSTVSGAVMYAHIDNFTGDCTNWKPIFDKKPPTDPNGSVSNTDSVKMLNTKDIINGISMLPNPFKNSTCGRCCHRTTHRARKLTVISNSSELLKNKLNRVNHNLFLAGSYN